jgi:hypothetical protein
VLETGKSLVLELEGLKEALKVDASVRASERNDCGTPRGPSQAEDGRLIPPHHGYIILVAHPVVHLGTLLRDPCQPGQAEILRCRRELAVAQLSAERGSQPARVGHAVPVPVERREGVKEELFI